MSAILPWGGRIGAARQRGTALVIGLLMLLVVTLIGVAAMQSTSLEEKMAGNLQQYFALLEVSDACVRVGEDWLVTRASEPADTADGASGVWKYDAPDPEFPAPTNAVLWWDEATRDPAWWAANATACATVMDLGDLAVAPDDAYLIEYQSFVPDSLVTGGITGPGSGKNYYRITARTVYDADGAGGAPPSASSTIQTTYVRRF